VAAGVRGEHRPPRLSLARREAFWGFLFVSPWILGFLAFTLIPMVATLVFTFMNITLSQERPLRFVGLDNYAAMLRDDRTWDALFVTLRYAAIFLPVSLIVPFAIALLLNSKSLRGSRYFRTLFFMPYVIPFVAAVFSWVSMLNPETGWVNGLLRLVGVEGPQWLNDPGWVYPALVLLGIWGIGSAIIINLAGLSNVPTELYDAARVDGAGWWGQLRNVTIPMLSPVIFYSLILGTVGILQYFLVPLVLNNGSGRPGGQTFFFNVYLYKTFFTFQNMSYGATLAWLLFVVILAATLLMFWSARYWVYYAGETK
ncbi:MAG: sugar ABC transporter permease, partial [Chloroflexota bacterium]|nr:sugar ABC transporter permease [Chloroflexota bacterium]